MRVRILLVLLCFAAIATGQSRFQNIVIHEANEIGGPEEPTIAISLKDTNILVAGSNVNKVYRSSNGGRTWEVNTLSSPYGVWGDPVVASNSKGHFFFFHLSDPTGLNWAHETFLDRMVAQRSKNGGKKWNKGSYTGLNHPKDQDKEWASIHPVTNEIALTWTQFDVFGSKDTTHKTNILFAKAAKSGKKWSDPVQINELSGSCVDDDEATEGAVPAFGSNNEVYVAWSRDSDIWFDYSYDGGETWRENDVFISNQPGGWSQEIPGIYRCNGMPVTIVDLSPGEHRGTVYINWTDQRNGEKDTDVFIVKSTDKGKTWSEPIRVNTDTTVSHQFLSALTIDQTTGYLYCVFYDRRNHLNEDTDVYLATSKDGGTTWINERISEKPFTPDKSVFFGDYNDISAHQGMIRPIWTHLENKKLSVRTALIYDK